MKKLKEKANEYVFEILIFITLIIAFINANTIASSAMQVRSLLGFILFLLVGLSYRKFKLSLTKPLNQDVSSSDK